MQNAIQKAKNPLKGVLRFLFLFCLCILTSCESNKIIVNDLDEKDANEILVFLASRNIEAEKVKAESAGGGGGSQLVKWNIAVKSSEASEGMRLLNQQGLPRRRPQTILDLYATSGLVPSDAQEKIKYQAALGEQLASTIRKYEGILDADVQISFPQDDPLNPGKTKGKITASVWVKHSGVLDDPNSHLKSKIQRYVSSSVTGLNYDDVTVVGERSRIGEDFSSSAITPEEKQYVTTWSVVIAKDSLSRFRMIFFAFTLLTLLLALTLVWTLWKVLPLLSRHGGIKALLSPKPLSQGPGIDKKVQVATPAKPAKEEESKESSAKANKNMDET